MCLNIDQRYYPVRVPVVSAHKAKTPTPFIAEQPLIVWKYLREKHNRVHSPIRGEPYVLGKLYTATMHYGNEPYEYGRTDEVEAGLHAIRFLHPTAEEMKAKFPRFTACTPFPAIIPAGAQYHLGTRDDVVSNQLIVYRNMDALLKAFKVKEAAPPVKPVLYRKR